MILNPETYMAVSEHSQQHSWQSSTPEPSYPKTARLEYFSAAESEENDLKSKFRKNDIVLKEEMKKMF